MSRVARFLPDSMWALPLGCVGGLVWANTQPESYYTVSQALAFLVNDIGLAFFLGLAMKELVEATLPGGTLHTWRKAALPLAAAVGGTAVPIGIFLVFLYTVGDIMLKPALVANCAVDIAGVYVAGRLIFGRHAAIPVLLLLALAMNAIGLVVLAAWSPINDVHVWPSLLIIPAAGVAFAFRRMRVRSFWWYLLGPGVLSWWALYQSGIHPALALVPIIPFMPHARKDAGLFAEADSHLRDTLTNFERWWQPPVEGILFLFGLVNAGVTLHGFEEGTWALPVAVLIGRPVGILAAAGIAVAAGLHLPRGVRWPDLAVIGCLSSIGLVMALFFASAAMPIGPLLQELKTGALVTSAGALVAFGAAWILGVGRLARPHSATL